MRFKKPIFALVAGALFFGTVEILLWAAGVQTLSSERDPWSGFSESVRVYEVDEAAGVYRTPPRATTHSFNYQEFSRVKAPDGLRVFVIGGSSAFGFPWGAGRAFPRVLGDALQSAAPGRVVESINAAAMSYGSHRLRLLVPEILSYEPDVLVIYSGHNEYVERDLHARLVREQGELSGLRRRLSLSRLYSLMTRVHERVTDEGEEPALPEAGSVATAELLGLDVDREAAVDVLPAERAEVRKRYEENLLDILERARRAGVAVVLCTVPSNLSGWVPNQSVLAADVSLEERGRVEEAVEAGRLALDAGAAERAREALEAAREIAPGYAATHFWLGRAYQALGRVDDARRSYVLARDADARPSRAESAINETIRRLAAERDVPLADIERAFEAAAPDGLLGFNLFEDYVHPKPAAHRRIAFELWKTFRREGLVPEAGPAEATEAAEVAAFERALGQPLPPVADTPDTVDADAGSSNPSLLFNLAVVLENQGLFERAMEKYEACLELHPSYYLARENLARLLFRQGSLVEAARAYRGVLEYSPDRVKSLIGLAESLRRLGQTDAALDALHKAVTVDPQSAAAYNSLGGTLAQLNRHAPAEEAFRTAVGLDPDDADTRVNLGLSLLFQQKVEEAAEAFQAALALAPHDLRARNGMAAVLTERGDLDGAEKLFRENLAVAPGDAFATSGLLIIESRRRGR